MQVEIWHNWIFKSLRTGRHIPLNTTCEPFDVPSQPKDEEKNLIYFLTIGTATSVVISIIIPLSFMICLKFSMDKAWHFYLMLQVVSNIKQFDILCTPASAYPTILLIHQISSFKIAEDPVIKSYIKYWYDYSQQDFRKYMFN